MFVYILHRRICKQYTSRNQETYLQMTLFHCSHLYARDYVAMEAETAK